MGYNGGQEKGWTARGGEGSRRAARVVGARRRPVSLGPGRLGRDAHATSPSPPPVVRKLFHRSDAGRQRARHPRSLAGGFRPAVLARRSPISSRTQTDFFFCFAN
ncbi:hypothetical protein VPH35_108794 [Triticum aestivum]